MIISSGFPEPCKLCKQYNTGNVIENIDYGILCKNTQKETREGTFLQHDPWENSHGKRKKRYKILTGFWENAYFSPCVIISSAKPYSMASRAFK